MRGQDYITEARRHNKAVWDGINALVALQREWNANDFGTTLPGGTGDNAGLERAEIGAGR